MRSIDDNGWPVHYLDALSLHDLRGLPLFRLPSTILLSVVFVLYWQTRAFSNKFKRRLSWQGLGIIGDFRGDGSLIRQSSRMFLSAPQ